jgi:hypothetical protein
MKTEAIVAFLQGAVPTTSHFLSKKDSYHLTWHYDERTKQFVAVSADIPKEFLDETTLCVADDLGLDVCFISSTFETNSTTRFSIKESALQFQEILNNADILASSQTFREMNQAKIEVFVKNIFSTNKSFAQAAIKNPHLQTGFLNAILVERGFLQHKVPEFKKATTSVIIGPTFYAPAENKDGSFDADDKTTFTWHYKKAKIKDASLTEHLIPKPVKPKTSRTCLDIICCHSVEETVNTSNTESHSPSPKSMR